MMSLRIQLKQLAMIDSGKIVKIEAKKHFWFVFDIKVFNFCIVFKNNVVILKPKIILTKKKN